MYLDNALYFSETRAEVRRDEGSRDAQGYLPNRTSAIDKGQNFEVQPQPDFLRVLKHDKTPLPVKVRCRNGFKIIGEIIADPLTTGAAMLEMRKPYNTCKFIKACPAIFHNPSNGRE
jgi:hypothetical protein